MPLDREMWITNEDDMWTVLEDDMWIPYISITGDVIFIAKPRQHSFTAKKRSS